MVNIYEEIKKLKEYALINNVPIMQDKSMDFLVSYIVKNDKKNILEVGTAIGYSAIIMALSKEDVKITSIEKDKDRYLEAVKNIKKFKLEDRITLIFNDSLEVNLKDKFDLIFIDAAKSKNEEIFKHFESNLDKNGAVITDNINFHGYVKMPLEEIKSRNIRGLVKKIRNYISFLKEEKKYKTLFYDVGDGVSVTEVVRLK